jgi:uncharacterized protein
MWQIITAGAILGMVSSLHCIGMCGPLALALPVYHLPKLQQTIAVLLYHLGRVLTYSLLGLLFGLAGHRIYMAGFQQWFSIILGVIMLILAFQYFLFSGHKQLQWLHPFYRLVQQLMNRFLQSKTTSGFLWLGMANGLLPCGMVYLALAGALGTTQVSQSVAFMFFFGTGTLPAMLALTLFGKRFTPGIRLQLKRVIPYCMAAMAVLFILRGLNLGIPFVSPLMPPSPQQAVSCH